MELEVWVKGCHVRVKTSHSQWNEMFIKQLERAKGSSSRQCLMATFRLVGSTVWPFFSFVLGLTSTARFSSSRFNAKRNDYDDIYFCQINNSRKNFLCQIRLSMDVSFRRWCSHNYLWWSIICFSRGRLCRWCFHHRSIRFVKKWFQSWNIFSLRRFFRDEASERRKNSRPASDLPRRAKQTREKWWMMFIKIFSLRMKARGSREEVEKTD